MKQTLLNLIQKYLGVPYIWGGDNDKGIDCSGLVQNLLACVGFDPKGDQTAEGLCEYFLQGGRAKVINSINDAMLGDLVFFGRTGHVHHVAMCVGQGKMVEAAHGGPMCKSIAIANARRAKVEINDMTRLSDLYHIIRIDGMADKLAPGLQVKMGLKSPQPKQPPAPPKANA